MRRDVHRELRALPGPGADPVPASAPPLSLFARPAGLSVDGEAFDAGRLSRRIAGHLARLRDLPPGSRIGVVTEPSAATPIALAAHALGGFTSVPLNPAMGHAERTHVLADAAPARVFGGDGLPLTCGESEDPLPEREVDDRPLLLLYTSGTTGPPKGAVLTAGNVASNLDGLASAWDWTGADTVVHALPLFHVHGLVLGWFGVLRRGGTLRWFTRFDPGTLGPALAEGRTVLFSVPTMVHRLAESTDPAVIAGLRHARLLVSGSAPLSVVDRERIEARTGRTVIERYGLTETLILTAARPGEGGTVGRAVPGVELRLILEDGGGIGEVLARGPNVFAGYWNRPDATAEVLVDGWFRTGDLAAVDAEGRYRVVGRKAIDLIKTGGYKVGAGEVEDALLSHPAVAEAAVLGFPDADLGERIVAFVVAREPVEAGVLVAHVEARIARHKRPREVRFVDALPRNAMGKLQKGRLR